jgi:dethiobiotin synthetase
MKPRFVVTGTDTGIGKSVFSAALTQALSARYWKPVQSGIEDETDTQFVERMVPGSTMPEAWRLVTPLSPHRSAEIDGVVIDTDALNPPRVDAPMVIEGAGGALVPVTRNVLYADIFARWKLPVIICARTALGTINHSLMTIEVLKARGVLIHGIAFIGEAMPDSETTIMQFSGIRRLGRLDMLPEVTPETLRAAFAAGFDIADFA